MGGSGDGGGTPSDASSSNSSRKNIDDLGTPNGKYQTYTFNAGETARYRSKRTITVSPAAAYVPDSADPAAQTPDPGYKAYTFTVTIRNTGNESVKTYFSPDVTVDGGAKADSISGDGYETSLDGTIPPGQMLTGKFAYIVPTDSKVLNVKHELYDSTVWTLKLS
jgi:uncharacterized protein affecting Mg2+/Co2+ transport